MAETARPQYKSHSRTHLWLTTCGHHRIILRHSCALDVVYHSQHIYTRPKAPAIQIYFVAQMINRIIIGRHRRHNRRYSHTRAFIYLYSDRYCNNYITYNCVSWQMDARIAQ